MPLTPSSQPGEGLPAKVHLVLGVRINHLPQQLCCHPLPQPGKELHGVISALGNAQGLCPEWETPCSHLPHHNRKPKSSPGPGRSPAHHQHSPVTAVGQLSQGCLTPCQTTAGAVRTSPPSCRAHLPAHSPATLEAQTGAEPAPAQGGLGVRARP